MYDVVLLRFEAPMMSFGAVVVDSLGHTSPFPGRSLLTGLLGNALGYDHKDFDRLSRLQARISHAVRRDRGGEVRTDYQTVDLGQPHLLDQVAWTTWGRLDPRNKSDNSTGTHIRYRDFIVDSAYTIALTLKEAEDSPKISEIVEALRRPARPLFLGRKCCIPSTPIFLKQVRAESLRRAVLEAPKHPWSDTTVRLWWHEHGEGGHQISISDERDWKNRIHVGSYMMYEGFEKLQEIDHDHR